MMKIALVHDHIVAWRGGERTFYSICRLFPKADIFTLFYNKAKASPIISERRINATFLQKMPSIKKDPRRSLLAPLYSMVTSTLDLRGYDLVISSSSFFAHGVITKPESCHICYCHTPSRYLWSDSHLLTRGNLAERLLCKVFLGYLRTRDQYASQHVDYYIASSNTVALRIKKYYGRESQIIYPPVNTTQYSLSENNKGYYLIVSALVPYKRIKIAVDAFNHLGLPLKIAGSGPEFRKLKHKAAKNVEFLGWVSDAEIRKHYSQSVALVSTAEEDFGIAIVEAQACGKPVIAYKGGGALETVLEGVTGHFFSPQKVDALIQAISEFEITSFDPYTIRQHAIKFDEARFAKQFYDFVTQKLPICVKDVQ